MKVAAFGAAVSTAGGCGGPAAPEAVPVREIAEVRVVPAELTVSAGGGGQLSAQANDARGHPVGGAEIAFASADPRLVMVSGRGSVASIGPVGRTTVRVASGSRQAIVPVIVDAGRPQRIEKLDGDQQAAIVGTELPDLLRVRVTDANNNPVPACRVRFEFTSDAPSPVESVSNDEGEAQARITLPDQAGPVKVTAVPEGNPQVQGIFTLQARPGPPTQIETAEAQSANAASGSTVQAAVRITDAHANGVAGIEVQWRVGKGGGSVDPVTSSTDESGTAATEWHLGAATGRNSLRAVPAHPELSAVEIAVAAVAEPAAQTAKPVRPAGK